MTPLPLDLPFLKWLLSGAKYNVCLGKPRAMRGTLVQALSNSSNHQVSKAKATSASSTEGLELEWVRGWGVA